jgi:hypothetical protein
MKSKDKNSPKIGIKNKRVCFVFEWNHTLRLYFFMMIFQLTAAFLIRFVFTILVIITNPREWDTLSSLGLAGPFFRAAGSTNWKEENENRVNDKATYNQ